jgi:hypothetical protein
VNYRRLQDSRSSARAELILNATFAEAISMSSMQRRIHVVFVATTVTRSGEKKPTAVKTIITTRKVLNLLVSGVAIHTQLDPTKKIAPDSALRSV